MNNELEFWILVGAALFGAVALFYLAVWRPLRRRAEERAFVLHDIAQRDRTVIVRTRALMDEETLRRVMQGWDEKDKRWEMLLELLETYSNQALQGAADAAGAGAEEQARALGVWLGIQQFWGVLLQLREAGPRVARGGAEARRKQA